MEIPENNRQAITEAIYGGAPRKIESIKLVREATGCGLAEAKQFVEQLGAELFTKEPEKFAVSPSGNDTGQGRRKGLVWIVLFLVACAGVVALVVFLSSKH